MRDSSNSYSARKAALFCDDERLFLDVMIRGLREDGRPEVHAVATLSDLDRPALSASLMLRSPLRTSTERNRAKRARRRAGSNQ
jgi:hypothetical protein